MAAVGIQIAKPMAADTPNAIHSARCGGQRRSDLRSAGWSASETALVHWVPFQNLHRALAAGSGYQPCPGSTSGAFTRHRLMLLGVVKQGLLWEACVELSCDVALEAADGFGFGFAFAAAALEVVA